jgi:Holliday junction resolvase RusA-like endonuclease
VAMHITVYGQPAPQGSKSAFRNQHTGRIQQVESSKKVKPWRDDVKTAAEKAVADAGNPSPITGPVVARMVFTVHRPAGHYGTGRNAGTVKPTAARRPATKGTGDLSKLIRSTEDALTAAGVWVDDALVVELSRAAKVYVGEDPEALDRPGARITVTEVAG